MHIIDKNSKFDRIQLVNYTNTLINEVTCFFGAIINEVTFNILENLTPHDPNVLWS